MTGQLDVLNVGKGHLELKFHQNDVIETTRAKRIIEDMLRRGYALFVHGKGDALIRVRKFIPKTGTYIIADGPEIPPEAVALEPKVARKLPGMKAVPMTRAKATVVGRSAGG